MESFTQWRQFLEGSCHPITVFSDHKILAYFQKCSCIKSKTSLVGPIANSLRLQNYISSRKQQGKVDALSWRSYLAPCPGDPTFDNEKQVILGPTWLQETWVYDIQLDSYSMETIREDLKTDAFAQTILTQIDSSWASCSQSQPPGMDNRQFKFHDGLLFFKKLMYVPNGSCRLRVVQNYHETYTDGHFGGTKTIRI